MAFRSKSVEAIGLAGAVLHPSVMHSAHQHQEVELNYVSEGGVRYLIGGQVRDVPARRLSVLWGAAPHQVTHVAKGTRLYWFTIPFSWLLQWHMPQRLLDTLFRGDLVISRSADPHDEALADRWLTDLRTAAPEHLRIVQLEMEARLRRLALAEAGRAVHRGPIVAEVSPVHRMAECIATHYTDPLGIPEIAASVGLHPNYAMNIFKKTFGMSMLEYLTQHRLFHARRLLATTDAKVADVAFASGFGSLNRFYAVFQKADHCSPKEYRKRFA